MEMKREEFHGRNETASVSLEWSFSPESRLDGYIYAFGKESELGFFFFTEEI